MRRSKYFIPACLLFVVTCFLVISACRKNKLLTEDTGYANDHANTEQTFNDVQTIADDASTVTSGSLAYRTTGSGCAVVTKSPGSILIDFGPSNCLCHDGRWRRGQIIITYTGNYSDVGSVHTITFNNFYQNNNKVTGTKTVTNMGPNTSGQPVFSIHVAGAVTLSGGGTISAVWDRTRTWTQGYNTPADATDDVYQITGSGTVTRANGMVVAVNIATPLVIANSCHWIESGTVTYSLSGNIRRTLNFGDATVCDDLATITLANGTVRDITLP